MPYLVDSNVVIDHLGEVPEASQFLDQFAQDGIVISIITYMEAFQGLSGVSIRKKPLRNSTPLQTRC
jgi:predicted nucleic acid-binding protein